MFNKPFRVKSNTQLKGSERKKIRSEILKHFPQLSEDDMQILLPNKETVTGMKIFTNTGDSVMVYCCQKHPVIFDFEQVFYPTVYMLWKFPNLLPTFTTWPLVFPKLTGGADLMLPGVILKEPVKITSYGCLKKGDRMAVNLTSNKAPIAVGQAALASDDMYMAARRGKAVKILHYVGDQLWSHGTKLAVPELGPPDGFDNIEDEGAGKDVTNVHGSMSAASPSTIIDKIPEKLGNKEANMPNLSSNEAASEPLIDEHLAPLTLHEEEEAEHDPQDAMDYLLQYCFLKAWKTSAKKPEFPLLTSNFYKLHMIPACPKGFLLDVKKSSYKKLSQFLDFMTKENLITTKELTKGVVSIMSVNWEHQMLKEFVFTLADLEEDTSEHEVKSSCTPKITEMFEVTTAVLPVMSLFNLRKGSKVLSSDIKKHLAEYIRNNNMQSPKNPSLVRLDIVLSIIICQPGDIGFDITREDLFTKFLSRMKRCYQIEYPTAATAILAKGKLEPIDIQVAKRTGNKKVTLIYNLELFGIDVHEFGRQCQHGVAASSSISSVPHRKGPQLLVQGNQVAYVGKLLQEKYEIPKKYIRGLEKAVKPKK